MPHHRRTLAHERNSIYKQKQHTIHNHRGPKHINNVARGLLKPSHQHKTLSLNYLKEWKSLENIACIPQFSFLRLAPSVDNLKYLHSLICFWRKKWRSFHMTRMGLSRKKMPNCLLEERLLVCTTSFDQYKHHDGYISRM